MKKLIYILLLLIISVNVFSQTYPITQKLGAPNTAVIGGGAIGAKDGIIWTRYFTDTTDANNQLYLKYTAGMIIRTGTEGTDFWVRNEVLTKWVQVNGGGSTGGFVYRDSASAINIVSLGAVGDGTTDNAAIFKLARNLATTYGYAVFIPAGTFYTSDSTLFNKTRVFGNGVNSVIKVTGTTSAFYLKDTCSVSLLKFIGTGQSVVPGGVLTTQNGIRVIGSGNSISYNTFVSLAGAGIAVYETVGTTIYRNNISFNYYVNCTIGNDLAVAVEETLTTGDIAYACTVGFRCRASGNNSYDNIESTYSGTNFELEGGGNGDHGGVSRGRFNHGISFNINIKSCNYAFDFKNCDLWSSNIVFGSTGVAKNVTISEGTIGGTVTITATSTNAATCVIRDNTFADLTLFKLGSDTLEYVNNSPNVTDPIYARTFGNAIGATMTLGTNDANILAFETNNSTKMQIASTGEVGIGTAPATNFRTFIVGYGNTSATFSQLNRNANGNNTFSVDDAGDVQLGINANGASILSLYGLVKPFNTTLGSATDSIVVKKTSNSALATIAASAIYPGLQQTMDVSSTLNKDNTIVNGANTIEITNNSLAGDYGLRISSNSTAASAGSQILFNAELSGANASASEATVSAAISNLHTGSGTNYGLTSNASGNTTNIAGNFTASGGTNNYAIIVPSGFGNVGIGTSTPTSIAKLQVIAAAGAFGIQGISSAGGVGIYGETSNATGVQGIHTTSGGVGVLGSATAAVTTNTAGQFIAQNGTNNYAITVPVSSGNVGFGTATPTAGMLHIVSPTTTGTTTTSGVVIASNSLTSGTGQYHSTTSLTSGNLLQLVSTSTTLAAGNEMLDISVTGVNGTNAITATGARISVTNTNVTSGTNIGLDVTATGATTKNVALNVTGGTGSSTSFAAQFTGRIATGGVTAPLADIDNGNGTIQTGSIIVTTSAGTNQTGNFSTGSQGLVGSNVGSIYQFLSSSTVNAHVYAGGTGATAVGAGLPGATMIMGASTLAENSTGNHPLLAGLVILPPTITGAAATVSNTASLYISAAPSTTVSGANFALLIDAGNAQLTNGNLTLNTAGNKINIATGSNASVGVSGAMTAGTITISTTAVTASSKIFLVHATLGGTQGILSVGTITAGTSFVINSSSATDTGTVNWWIIN